MNCTETDNQNFLRITDSILDVQILNSEILRLTSEFFSKEGFLQIIPPILHEQVKNKKQEFYLPHSNNRYSLNSSNALYLGAYASFFNKVYSISPTFREENHSINHLVEFRMIEAEFVDSNFKTIMDFVEKFINYILKNLQKSHSLQNNSTLLKRIYTLEGNFKPVRQSYKQLIENLIHCKNIDFDYKSDLSSVDHLISNYIHTPTFVVDYPFGTWTARRDGDKVLSFNLILSETYGELCEGCERTNDTKFLADKLNQASITKLEWYVSAIEKIKKSRAGFGIGLERLVRWIAGMERIQDVVLFPR